MRFIRTHALSLAAFLWGVAEATLFFIVPDVILSYIGVRQGPRAAAKASLIAAFGAGVGGVAMYLWSQSDPAAAREAVLAVPAISAEMAARAEAAMRESWFWATFLGPLTSTPYKLYAIVAPQLSINLPAFALASVAARLPRFLIVGVGAGLIAQKLRPRLGERGVYWLLAGCWLVFYLVFFALMPN